MHAANRIWPVLIGLAAAAAACRPAQDQDIAVENGAAVPTEIEALPPDESVATPTEELANGNGQSSKGDAAANAY